MKKICKALVFILVVSLFTTGCGNKAISKSKVLNCKLDKDIAEGIKISSVYKIEYSGKYIDRVTTVETVEANSDAMLDAYKQQFDSMFSEYRNIKGYSNNVEKKDNKVISNTTIDYKTINIDDLVKIDSDFAPYFENGKIRLDTMKEIYKQIGAECDK